MTTARLIVSLALCIVHNCAFATLIVGSKLQLHAATDKWGGAFPSETGSDIASQADSLNPLAVAVAVIDSTPDLFTRTSGSANANWNSADNGNVSFREMGWERQNAHSYTHYLAGDPYGTFAFPPKMWSYTLVPEIDSVFQLAWDISATQDSTHEVSGPFSLSFAYGGSGFEEHRIDLYSTGQLTQDLLAGVEYTVFLGHHLQVTGGGQAQHRIARFNADFIWKISTIPLPGTAVSVMLALLCFRLARSRGPLLPGT